ncbi:MAG: LuxR C-terminal-related transcriptional regulator [Rhizobium sp.]|nr:LuxR C-terminal-related transcriptional regulator [Rhizobium sp.]
MSEVHPDEIQGVIRAILRVGTVTDLADTLSGFYDRIGFSDFGFGSIELATGTVATSDVLTSFDSRMREDYCAAYAPTDPMLEAAVRADDPAVWQVEQLKASPQHHRFHEFLLDHGLKTGVNIPLLKHEGRIHGVVLTSRRVQSRSPQTIATAMAVSAAALLKQGQLLQRMPAVPVEPDPRLRSLSQQQREILSWIAGGKSNGDIALIMALSKRAVDYHVAAILQKLGVASRTQAAAMLPPPDRV